MKQIRLGSVGLGRLGYEHAKNIATCVPGAKLIALCDKDEARLQEVSQELDVENIYTDFAGMCKNPDIDGVVIVSPSAFHAEQIKIALEAGKDVFCEKPLDVTIEKCKQAEKLVEEHPDRICMIGFMRRYDHSYQLAKQKIDNGEIGRVILIRAYTQDPIATIEGTLAFAPHSGGQFLDMCVHDIDLCRWFTGGKKAKQLWAIGGCFEFEQYRELNDGDNVSATIQFEDETMAFLFAGRAAAQGANIETEIVGTRGTLRIGAIGTDSMLEIMDTSGIRREIYSDFLVRWHDAYITEMIEYVNCIRERRKPDVSVYDGTASLEIAYKCKESFETGKMLTLD